MKSWITIAAVGRRGLPTALVVFLLACGCGSDAGRVGGGFLQAAVGIPTTNLRDRCVSDFDWNETGSVRPDLILADLIHLLHPNRLPGHQLMFFGPVELTKRDETS